MTRKLAKECQYCAAYEDLVIDYKFEKNCHRHEKPKCYTAYKEVTIRILGNLDDDDVLGVHTGEQGGVHHHLH